MPLVDPATRSHLFETTVKTFYILSQRVPSWMFDRVLNTSLPTEDTRLLE